MFQGKILITKIQRFSLHDGPGIRTTVFLKGCSLHCPWCCNPENISNRIEPYYRNGKEEYWGQWISEDELYFEIIKDKAYYIGELKQNEFLVNGYESLKKLPGGVTFSGGEALLQIDSCLSVLHRLGSDGIHRTLETSLFASSEQVKVAVDYFDLFYVDVKILDRERCRKILGGELDLYLSNFEYLVFSGKPIVIRIPIIGGYTDCIDNVNMIADVLTKYQKCNILKVELLKGHHLGNQKYLDLGKEIPETNEVTDEEMIIMRNIIEKSSIKVEILKM